MAIEGRWRVAILRVISFCEESALFQRRKHGGDFAEWHE
jgi:hypothetical protein